MDNSYFAAAADLAIIKAPVSVTADGNSVGFDFTHYTGRVAFILAALNTAGTDPTMAIKLRGSADIDLIGAITGVRAGNGTISELRALADAVTEAVTIAFTSATAFTVTGATSGNLAAGVIGTKYSNAQIEFVIAAGSTAFEIADTFIVAVTARTYADIPGAVFAALAAGASVQRIVVDSDKLPRFGRFAFDIGGTDNPAYTLSIVALGLKQ